MSFIGLFTRDANCREISTPKKWSMVTQDQWILNRVQGYRLELLGEPVHSCCLRGVITNSSQEWSLIYEEFLKMLQQGAIIEVTLTEANPGFYSSLSWCPREMVPQRPMVNFKCLNKYIVPYHFNMEGIHTLRDLLRRNDWMTKVDLKDACFMIPIYTSQDKCSASVSESIITSSLACLSACPVLSGSLPRP